MNFYVALHSNLSHKIMFQQSHKSVLDHRFGETIFALSLLSITWVHLQHNKLVFFPKVMPYFTCDVISLRSAMMLPCFHKTYGRRSDG